MEYLLDLDFVQVDLLEVYGGGVTRGVFVLR